MAHVAPPCRAVSLGARPPTVSVASQCGPPLPLSVSGRLLCRLQDGQTTFAGTDMLTTCSVICCRIAPSGTRPKSAEPAQALGATAFGTIGWGPSHIARARVGGRDHGCGTAILCEATSQKSSALSCLREPMGDGKEEEEESPRRGHRRTSALSDGSLHVLLS